MRPSTQTHLLVILALVSAAALAGCGGAPGPKPTAKFEDVLKATEADSAQMEIKQMNEKLFAAVMAESKAEDYVICTGDLVQVSVFEAQELQREARVGARGFVTLPLLGAVQVAGLTTREAEQKIEDLYRSKYLHDPHVSVFVKEPQGQKVTLVGSVKKPGTYEYPARRRLLDVIALAEGFSENAGRSVQVRRPAQLDGEQPSTFIIDMDELIKKGRTELNVEIRGGDVVYVPEAGTVYVDGAVKKPGSYPIKQAMSINEAIVAAGGVTFSAKSDDIKLVRYMGDGSREVVQLTAEQLQANPVTVKDRDLIYVEFSGVKSAFASFNIYLGPFGGFGYSRPAQ